MARTSWWWAAACVAGGLSGCAASPLTGRVTTFASAASAATLQMKNAYTLVEQVYQQAALATLVNQFDTKGFNPASIQPLMPATDMQARTDLLNGLTQYATVLAEVSGGTAITALDTQSEALGSQLETLSQGSGLKGVARYASAEGGGAAAAVAALGQLLIEAKTAKNLPGTLDKGKAPVDTICTLLEQDIGTPEGLGLRNELRDKYVELIADQRTYIYANEAKMSPDEKRTEIEQLPQLVTAEQQGDAALAATATALQKLAAANDALTETKKDKNAPAFRALVTQLVAQGQQLGTVYASATAKK